MKEKLSYQEDKQTFKEAFEDIHKSSILPMVESTISKNKYLKDALYEIYKYDQTTFEHVLEMANYATIITNRLNLSHEERELLIASSLVHDVGKIKVNPEIIKKSDNLTDEEYEEIKEHVRKGVEYLRDIGAPEEVIAIIAGHHEHQGNKSYPRGTNHGIDAREHDINNPKRKEKSPTVEKIERLLAIIDHFEAATADRPYNHQQTPDECQKEMKKKFTELDDQNVIRTLIGNLRHSSK